MEHFYQVAYTTTTTVAATPTTTTTTTTMSRTQYIHIVIGNRKHYAAQQQG
jgi:hypothetical protein